MSAHTVAFCTTCKGRVQHIEQTLPKNISDNANYPNLKYIILDYGSPDRLLTYLKENYRDSLERGRLVVYSFREQGPFRMAHAKNMAHRLGMLEGADILVNLDADNFASPNFAQYLDETFRSFEGAKDEVFLWARMIKEGADRLPRGISGRIAVSANAFLKSGGYDECYDTWAPDDKDFNARLRRMGCRGIEIDNHYLGGVLHNDKMRFKEYPHVRKQKDGYDEFALVEGRNSTIANYGQIGCGTVFKNFSDVPIVLRPLPTRIFGIGMHKTGTTSLNTALKVLGFESAHWKSAHWVKAIWQEINSTGQSRTLEQSYALSDLPIPLLFRQLDKAYPGSKFILTTRNEVKWLESVRKHWNPDFNKFRQSWDSDPFTHRIHEKLYGQTWFDPEVFVKRFRRHNADVIEHFKNRPSDLLVFDLDRDCGCAWALLCEFLGVRNKVPVITYPKLYATE
jgi:glycosyltransferase involved in cell wall biosynthesis